MKNIYVRIPFFYKWNNCSNIKCHIEELQRLGYKVDVISKKEHPYNPVGYDLVMLHGTGAGITKEEYKNTKVPVLAFGWSDPNLYNEEFYNNCDSYFTNDLPLARHLLAHGEKEVTYYQTSCYKNYHRNLNLPKETDILIYGVGSHKFVTNRNEIVDGLRKLGFRIKVFGRGWNSHPDTFEFLEGEGLIQEINKAHLHLDLSNKTTAWAHRIFENSGCATPVLTMRREDTCQLFEENKEIFLYNELDVNEIGQILTKLLQDKNHLRQIGLNAQARCYKDHDISVRIKQLLPYIENIKKGIE